MAGLRIGGWTVYAHPLFIEQVEALVAAVRAARAKNPEEYRRKNSAKRLAAVLKLAFEDIPSDPTRPTYLLGDTLGGAHKHWLRAKFFQQYRLFFRCDRPSRTIILGWVNDEATKRAYGSRTDAYRIFAGMLAAGEPPDEWAALRAACVAEENRRTEAGEPSLSETLAAIRAEVE